MKTIQGFVMIDVDVAALNNAGNDTSTHLDNAVMTKKIRKNGKEYPYVSGQAWRYWWRETLEKKFNWNMSPIIREKRIAYTEADPMIYPDDDMFGYMRAGKKKIIDPDTGKEKSVNATLTRVSPLKNSALIAVNYNPIVQFWSSMSRQEGDAVPYGKDEYCAVMKGMFSIDIDMVGTFSPIERSGFQNINEEMRKLYLQKGAIEIDDPYLKDKKGNPIKLIRIDDSERLKRIKDTISALKYISGGAKQTTNMADVTPKLIILCKFASGNHPFSHLAKEELGKPVFSIDALKEVIREYQDDIEGKIYVGKRSGFMDELNDEFVKLQDENKIKYGAVNEIIDKFVNELKI
ncbi:type I-B CRISPR-associated protein Cas7/Cst2/DevR [Desulfothermus naphthae]